ncbi:MAG: hypothetical protein ACP5UM_10960 [Anaerolineae bacterium]
MLTDRIIGAFTFRKGIYAEVEKDTAFTNTAWMLVAVVGFLNQLGARAQPNILRWFFGALLGTVGVVLAFALGAYVVAWVGRALFNAQVTLEELVRTLGLAYVWNVVGVVGILAALSDALACILAPATIAAALLGLIAWFVAAKEALDLDWTQTIITVVIGWVVVVVITFLVGLVLGAIGLGAAAVGRAIVR